MNAWWMAADVYGWIVLWSKVKFIHLDLLPTQMNFHSNMVVIQLYIIC